LLKALSQLFPVRLVPERTCIGSVPGDRFDRAAFGDIVINVYEEIQSNMSLRFAHSKTDDIVRNRDDFQPRDIRFAALDCAQALRVSEPLSQGRLQRLRYLNI
jgi:hypothetical protein